MLRPTTTSSASSPSPSRYARLTSGSRGAWWTLCVRKRPSTTRRRAGEGRRGITLHDGLAIAEVRQVRVDLRRTVGHGRLGGVEGREQVVVHDDRCRRGQCLVPRPCRDDGDRVTEGPDLVVAKDRAVGDAVLDAVRALDVCRRHDTDHAGHGRRRGVIDAADDSVGVRTADDGQLQRARHPDVGAEGGRAAGLGHGRRPRMRHAKGRRVVAGQQVRRGELAAQEAAGQLDRVDDLDVAGATAEVAAERALHLGAGGVRVGLEQLGGGHDHAGDAEAALHGPGQHERLLDEARPVRRAEPLDRGDLGAVERGDLRDAREDGPAIDEDHARPALALPVARLLGAGQPQVVAQQVEQDRLALVGDDLHGVAVDGEPDPLHDWTPPRAGRSPRRRPTDPVAGRGIGLDPTRGTTRSPLHCGPGCLPGQCRTSPFRASGGAVVAVGTIATRATAPAFRRAAARPRAGWARRRASRRPSRSGRRDARTRAA